ncbi:adenosine deaminase [Clostridium sp. 'deep sea']|uniref:adenosine deaminase n=1 Tax=Clostridium sp. 'deep sea' TaxID=2779445 RepID=UPI0018965AB5|nr:adenosine deaminase [Clostridium sp. 'deep sea']QOR35009.1 adenosine deaminase [Clostridium sp. 'deep sea']
MKSKFINSLQNNDLATLKQIPKSDLHNHATRGGNIKYVLKNSEEVLANLPKKFTNLTDMQSWYEANIKLHCKGLHGFVNRIEAAFLHALDDGVQTLVLSFGLADSIHYNNSYKDYINDIKHIHQRIAPEINFIPELSLSRTQNIVEMEEIFEQLLSYNFFKSIDLIGDENIAVDEFKSIYKKAKQHNLIRKAHIGEFSDALSVKNVVEALDLNQVQHGIAAVNSQKVMNFLADNKIQLNICPTSNVMLSLVNSYREHPISILHENGIPITINTDDMLIFNQSVSQEYLNLYNNGVLSATELNEIRETGLGVIKTK